MMTFKEFRSIVGEHLDIDRPSDIARALDVSPQVVNNWKSKDFVPNKYIKILRKKIKFKNDRGRSLLKDNNFESQSLNEVLLYLYSLIKKNVYLLIFLPLVFFSIFYLEARFLLNPLYESSAKLVPVSESSSSNIGGLASQFGISVKEESVKGLSSTIMYPDILKSRTLARRLLSKKFSTEAFGDSISLQNILSPLKGDTSALAMHYSELGAINKLLKSIRLINNNKTPLMTIYVSGFEGKFSTDLCKVIIEELQSLIVLFNLRQVIEKKNHLAKRILEIGGNLDEAEESLRIYIDRNRSIASSPSLILEQERLNREAEVLKQMYITIKTQYEMAQIEEINKKGLMQILDPPELIGKVFPNVRKRGMLGFLVGTILSMLVILAKDWYSRNKAYLAFKNIKL
jgi:uncharacterized protein involved in exopolysaccharide biosynthesis